MKKLMYLVIALGCLSAAAQVESADQLKYKESSISEPYQPSAENHVFVRSKLGYDGVNPTDEANAAIGRPVREIVLVYTEMEADGERKSKNIERWDNLLFTYPEFFQKTTVYKNICQCNAHGDEQEFKRVQGFYIYFADGGAAKTVAAEPAKVEKKDAVKEQSEIKETAKVAEPVAEEPVAVAPATATVKKEEPVKEARNQKAEAEEPAENEAEEEAEEKTEEEVREVPAKVVARPAAPRGRGAKSAPRRAKVATACRPACYGYGNEDIDTWFQENVTLTKKQKRKGDKTMANVSLMLDHDGIVTRAMVSGPDTDLNKLIQEAAMKMNGWKAAVRNGVAVKSQVRMVLKVDGKSEALKSDNVMVIPRFPDKCACVSDEEIFDED